MLNEVKNRSFKGLLSFLTVFLLLSFINTLCYGQQEEAIPKKILKLREEAEKGISLFLHMEFDESLKVLSNSLNSAQNIILEISKEGTKPQEETSIFVEKIEKDKSEIITSIRKITAKAIKYYVIGDIKNSIKSINEIAEIINLVISEVIKYKSESEYKKEIENKLSKLENLKKYEKEILSKYLNQTTYQTKIKTITNIKVQTITNVITNRIEKEITNQALPILSILIASILTVVLAVILIMYLKRNKRIKDISDLL